MRKKVYPERLLRDLFVSSRRAFTLLELLLSIALIGIVAGFSMPVAVNYSVRNDIDTAVNQTVTSLRRAQTLAMAGDSDSNWGVKLETGSVIIFSGTSYATRNTAKDEITSIATPISFPATTEIIYTKYSGLPAAGTTMTLNSLNGLTRDLVINSKGIINY